MRKFTNKKSFLRRGITLVETIVALTVILIISISTTTLIVNQAQTTAKVNAKISSISLSESVISAYRFSDESDNNAKFETLLLSLNDGFKKGEETEEKTTYKLDLSTYSVTISVFKTESNNKLEYTASLKDGEEIYKIEYFKR